MVFVYAATLFVSAMLLFIIQPMVGKMVLPVLGGTPSIWNTCMFFFQTVVLAGYAYAHGSVAWLGVRLQAGFHILLLLIPLFLLPIGIATGIAPSPETCPIAWLLWRLTVSVGLPLFLVAGTAPLLQQWFAQTRHPAADDPYFLYAASNAGSLLALLSYPVLVERHLLLLEQGRYWSAGYLAFVVMIIVCAILLWQSHKTTRSGPEQTDSTRFVEEYSDSGSSGEITLRRRAKWIFLAMVPSSLLLGVTTHITTNISAVPLLWVIPLALYLISFILVFARKTLLPHRFMVLLLPYVLLLLSPRIFFEGSVWMWTLIPSHLLIFFVVAMVCHGTLASMRPTTRHLTEFYFFISVGGVLGGFFNAVLAPLIFNTVIEYPLMLVISCFLVPSLKKTPSSSRERWLDLALPAALAAVCVIFVFTFGLRSSGGFGFSASVLTVIVAMACFWFRNRPIRFAFGFAVFVALMGIYVRAPTSNVLLMERNFFGVKSVIVDYEKRFRTFVHGNTNHGMQWIDPVRRQEPTSYFHRTGPVGDLFSVLREMNALKKAAIVGLGVGTLAAYAEPGQHFVFYEIDPAVVRIAENPDYFTFLTECKGTYEVILGDGRLSLVRAPDHGYNLIMLDAFSSDAVPTHLLTLEAIELYLQKLDERGILLFNITNAYLDLSPIVANLADRAGLVCLHRADLNIDESWLREGRMRSHYVAMARNREDLGPLVNRTEWEPLPGVPGAPLWTDQFSDILRVFRLSNPYR